MEEVCQYPHDLHVHPVSREQEPDQSPVLLPLELGLVAVDQASHVAPGLPHLDTGAEDVLDALSSRPEQDRRWEVVAALVQDPALIEESYPISNQPVDTLEDGLPLTGWGAEELVGLGAEAR